MPRYIHDCMSSETIPFAVCIDKFSLRARRGYYETSVDEQGGKWSLILYMSDGDGYEDFIEIHLRRNKYNGTDQFVELKLSIVDCIGFSSLFESLRWPFGPEKLCFTGSSDTHKVLSVKSMSRLDKLCYLPNNTLTLRGEMVISEGKERRFETEDGFKGSLEKTSSRRAAAVFWKLLLMILLIGVKGMYAVIAAITYLYRYVILPSVDIILLFAAVLAFSYRLFAKMKKAAETIVKLYSRKCRNSSKRNRYSPGDRQLVPAGAYGKRHVANAIYDTYSFHYPEEYGSRKQSRIYLTGADHSYRRRDRFLCE